MRYRRTAAFVAILAITLVLFVTMLLPEVGVLSVRAQEPAPAAVDASLSSLFTYQGILENGGQPASGAFDFQFALFNAAGGGVQRGATSTSDNVTVTRGLFSALVNTGANFGDEQLYIQVAVRPGASTGAYTPLAPRQLLTAVPQARYALVSSRATTATTAVLAQALQVPWAPATSTSQYVVDVGNFGSGPAMRLQSQGAGSTLFIKNSGTSGAIGIESSATNLFPSVLVNHEGAQGYAGFFDQNNTANADGGIFARTRGPGYAARVSLEGSGPGVGVFVQDFSVNAGSFAAVFQGDVAITPSSSPDNPGNLDVAGALTKGSGAFRIDHPLDPANKYLYHSFVESPDMMNVYNGNVTLDGAGEATVTLPDWFEALNRDFRYQLTAIGAPGPNLYVAQGVQGNAFRIAGGAPGLQVSWQVTGIRQDPWANDHRIQVEVPKSGAEAGAYLYPQGYGQPASLGIAAVRAAAVPAVAAETLLDEARGQP